MQTDEPIEYQGHRITIKHDDDPLNPRFEYDNAGVMVCHHGRYTLGDDHSYSSPIDALNGVLWELNPDHSDVEDMQEAFALMDAADIIWLPLYLYDHSGITMQCTPFSCPWDSGQVGFTYITYKKLAETLGVKDAEKDWKPDADQIVKAHEFLKGEVATYDNYLTGNVYGYVIEKPLDGDDQWEETDSCWGFNGDVEYCLEAAKGQIGG